MKSTHILLITVLIAIFALFPGTLFGQSITYTPLVSDLPNIGASTTFKDYLPGIFSLLIAIAGALAVIFLVIGGIQYIVSDSIGGKEDGRNTVSNALIGLILALASWVLLNTINPNILSFTLQIQRQPPPAPTTIIIAPPPTPGSFCTIPTGVSCVGPACRAYCVDGQDWPQDAAIRSLVTSWGYNIRGAVGNNTTDCVKVGESNCTTVYRLGGRALNGLQWLATNCQSFNSGAPCILNLTGGTEFWAHQTHGPGALAVDLGLSTTLDNFIKNNTSVSRSLGTTNNCISGYSAWEINGSIYVLENNHWHVCYR